MRFSDFRPAGHVGAVALAVLIVGTITGALLTQCSTPLNAQSAKGARFTRVDYVEIDSQTHIDVIKDTTTGFCREVYRTPAGVAELGAILCGDGR